MVKPEETNSSFPEIRISELKIYATRWIRKYPEIQITKVLLYRNNTEYSEIALEERCFPKDSIIALYRIVFEFSNPGASSELKPKDYGKEDAVSCFLLDCKIASKNYPSTRRNPFMDLHFPKLVYINKPVEKFKNEWVFHPIKDDEILSSYYYHEKELPLVLVDTDEKKIEGETQKPGIYNTDIAITKDKDLKWGDIRVTFLSESEFHIQYKSHNVTRSFKYAGFENRKNRLPIQSWMVLREASIKNNTIPWEFKTRKNIEKIAQTLRSKFRALFPGIDSKTDPVPIDSKNKEYRFAFQLDSQQ